MGQPPEKETCSGCTETSSMSKRNPKYSAYAEEIALRPKGSTANSIDIYLTKENALFLSRALLNVVLELQEDKLLDIVVFMGTKQIKVWVEKTRRL